MAMVNAIDREYLARVQDLGKKLRGKVVRDSAAGHSGYLLRFVDGEWVAVWLDPLSSRMDFLVGNGDPSAAVTALLSNLTPRKAVARRSEVGRGPLHFAIDARWAIAQGHQMYSQFV